MCALKCMNINVDLHIIYALVLCTWQMSNFLNLGNCVPKSCFTSSSEALKLWQKTLRSATFLPSTAVLAALQRPSFSIQRPHPVTSGKEMPGQGAVPSLHIGHVAWQGGSS